MNPTHRTLPLGVLLTGRVFTLDQLLPDSFRELRFATQVLTIFAVVALLLTIMGLYGVVSYSVAQRRREIGIRVALGAQTTDVLRLVLKQGMIFVLIGEIVGIWMADRFSNWISTPVHRVWGIETTFWVVAVLVFLVSLVACYVPARRATKVDPLIALRNE